MGKQAFDQRKALANAARTSGPAIVPPPKKEKAPAKEQPQQRTGGKGRGRGKAAEPEPQPTRKELEEQQRNFVEENARQRNEFYVEQASKKAQECKSADQSFTYVEDKDTRKPKAISDISEYWVSDLGLMPYMPGDNAGLLEDPDDQDVDARERLEYLSLLNDQLKRLLKMRFNVFWSQVIYDKQLRRCLDSYLRYVLRSHDIPGSQTAANENNAAFTDPLVEEERTLAREISQRMLAVLTRLSRPKETSHDFLSDQKFADIIYEKNIYDIPKLIDICTIYGDSNREAVTKIIHSVFNNQIKFLAEFHDVVQHMYGGLHQCCSPLQQAASGQKGKTEDLSTDESLAFLPDILSCFNAIFCFFPEESVENLMNDSYDVEKSCEAIPLPLADIMVLLHDALVALEPKKNAARDGTMTPIGAIRPLLGRLLSLVLGFHMAPRRGANAFQELLDWLRAQEGAGRSVLLLDIGRHGLENTAMEWLASGLVDDAQLDFLEQLCGPVLGSEARRRHRGRPAPAASAGGTSAGAGPGGGGAVSSTASRSTDTASDKAKIKEVREVVGTSYGEGFILQCLLHYGGSVPAVVGGILDETLPPQLAALPKGLAFGGEADAIVGSVPQENKTLSAEDKRRIVERASNMGPDKYDAEDEDIGAGMYDDDFDDFELGGVALNAGAMGSESDNPDSREDGSSGSEEIDRRWNDSKGGGKGRGKGRGKGPVQGQTIQARRKEENKAMVANHHRKDRAMAKMRKGMMM